MRFLQFLALLIVVSGVAYAMPASAQESVQARSATHDGYSRLVFEWSAKPSYSVSKEGGRVLIRFAKAAKLNASGVTKGQGNIRSVEVISSGTEPLQVAVTIPDGSRFRDFIVQNKLILDVYDSATAEKPAPERVDEKIENATAPAPVKEVSVPDTAKTDVKTEVPPAKETSKAEPKSVTASSPTVEKEEDVKGDFSVSKAESAAPAPVGEVEATKVPAPAFDPHVITLTSITSVGMAVFERSGWLWMVLDNPELSVSPQITGPQKDKLPPLEKVEVPSAIAYRMEKPEGLHVQGEGGGLSWRIILSPKDRPAKPVEASIDNDTGKIIWPIKNMGKVLSFPDPAIGDKITAVTAGTAAQYTGRGRNFVHLSTLDSVIGLAFVPRSDDVKADVSVAQVEVARPGGLALSSAKDTQPEKIRQEITGEKAAENSTDTKAVQSPETGKTVEKGGDALGEPPAADTADAKPVEGEPVRDAATARAELAKVSEEKPTGNNIYNFPRWEMGGIPALESNQHVMMVEIGNKPEERRVEDMITMVKLLLANNRGPEALGMLRIALQMVPDLEENHEFQSLRGAALALSGKYDEAFNDFSHEALSKYDDIKYWRAYVLAGLEDWAQAIKVLPTDMTGVSAYPKEIRTPLTLVFAEIALRGGKVSLAEKILDMLKPELPKLPLPYASAWNYLAGEAERQKGNADRAVEYWEPLVKNGKDDLYRAKAGLSLTRLQIDQKKLKPDEAINRLEGLRYAWRGDELETLINYRLGQMYIENKDYLKGLTVLRNATTLTPGLQIGQDVRTYMTNSFRDVFVNNRLQSVSPLEAISIYEEFKDLTPQGEEGYAFVDKLAERLVDADLLGRAASLLEYQVNNRLQGDKKAEVAIRLAAIRLLDGNPDGALRSLEIAQDTLNKIAGGAPTTPAKEPKPQDVQPQAGDASADTNKHAEAAKPAQDKPTQEAPAAKFDPEKQRQINLLKARALSMKKKPDEALAILEEMRLDPDVNRLRTDIAWSAGKWEEAAMALNDLIVAEDISGKMPLTDYQRDIILNRAIALNLSGNRVALANLRERHNAQMKDTTKGKMFEIVTRPRRPDMIGSREAIESMISEIDLFKGFVDSYAGLDKKTSGKPDAAPTGKAEEKAPVSAAEKSDAAEAGGGDTKPLKEVTGETAEDQASPDAEKPANKAE